MAEAQAGDDGARDRALLRIRREIAQFAAREVRPYEEHVLKKLEEALVALEEARRALQATEDGH